MGEQVKDAIGKHWLDRVHSDLDGAGYTIGASVLPACAVNAPHRRDRLWFVADTISQRRERGKRSEDRHEPYGENARRAEGNGRTFGIREDDVSWCGNLEGVRSPDGKTRRSDPSIRVLDNGVPNRMGALKAYGNAVVPQLAAVVISSYMEARP
jgi:DNA (cytosine-5)-methyltransferase 1